MKALLLESPKHFTRIETEAPSNPGPGDALVRVHRVGICGTDISGYLGKMPFFSYPRIPGHELGIEVLEVGDGVTNVKPGDRCSVERPTSTTPTATRAAAAVPIAARSSRFWAFTATAACVPQFPSSPHAEASPPSTRLAVYEQLAAGQRTLAIGCHAVNRAAPQRDESCLVIGAGPIGLSVLEFVKLTGAKTIVLDVNDHRLEFCRTTMGVPHTVKLTDNVIDDLRGMTDGHLPDVVIDATGSSVSMSSAFGYIAPGGRLVFVGITTEEVRFKHPVFHRPEGTLLCSRNALPEDFDRIIGLIEGGQIDTKPWITHRSAFDDLPGLFPSYTRPETGVIKAIVEVD